MDKLPELGYQFCFYACAFLLLVFSLTKLYKKKNFSNIIEKSELYHIYLSCKFVFQAVFAGMDPSKPFVKLLKHRYEKGYFCINLILLKFVILFHPDHIKVLLTDKENVRKPAMYNAIKDWVPESSLVSSGNCYREKKKLLLTSFHMNALHSFLPVIEKTARKLVKVMKESGEVCILPLLRKSVFDILYDVILGIPDDSDFKNNTYHLRKLYGTLEAINDSGMNVFLSSDIIFNLTAIGRKFKRNKNILRGITEAIVKEKLLSREKSTNDLHNNTQSPFSVLDSLLNARNTNPEMTLKSIYDETELFLAAATESTTSTITFILLLLKQHPDIHRRVREEVEEVFGKDTDRLITSEDLQKMKYLECVIKETLRLYPPFPNICRIIDRDVSIDNKVFPKGYICVISIFHLHRNPHIYENPTKFYPERFLPENDPVSNPYAFIPFSSGPRMCIGYRLAIMEIKVVFMTIFRNLKIECDDKLISYELKLNLNLTSSLQMKFNPKSN